MVAVIDSSTPRFRRFDYDDVDSIVEIEKQAYQFPWSVGIFNDCIRVGYECIALEIDKQLIGYSIMSVGAGESHILNLCIEPAYHNQGLGRKLLLHMIARATRLNAKTMFLEVRQSNLAARHLYESIGFNEIGIRRLYYPADHAREDGIIFALEISS